MDDVDVSDLAEVRRRVVEPVLAAAEGAGELTIASLRHDPLPGWEGSWADVPSGLRKAWLVISADGLVVDLIAWHQDLEDVSVALDEDDDSVPQGPTGVWVREVSDHEYVDLFEARRDDLVERLRAEVEPEFVVLTPLRIP